MNTMNNNINTYHIDINHKSRLLLPLKLIFKLLVKERNPKLSYIIIKTILFYL